jgi:hypothetical protein
MSDDVCSRCIYFILSKTSTAPQHGICTFPLPDSAKPNGFMMRYDNQGCQQFSPDRVHRDVGRSRPARTVKIHSREPQK